ncbi:MAG: hypothetical protein D6706_20535 [Chloroflexi bacterium]|nr:MAG: hypothetical protein D6706_20535 [Chloroflexota bacterium]
MAVIRTNKPARSDEMGGLVFLTQNQLDVIRGLLGERPLWAASYEPRPTDEWARDFGAELLARLVYVQDGISVSEIKGKDMAINVNVDVSTGCGCGCGSGGSNGTQAAPLTNGGTWTTPVPTVSEPQAFDDWGTEDDYRKYKCELSNRIVSDLTDTLASWQSLTLGLIGAGGAGLYALFSAGTAGGMITGLMSLGLSAAASVWVLVGLFITLLVLGVTGFAWFSKLAATVDKQRLICRLYWAEDDATARQAIRDEFGVATQVLVDDGDIPDAAKSVVLEIVDALVPEELLASLFQIIAEVTDLLGGGGGYDCSGCAQGDLGVTWDYGQRGTWYYADGVTPVPAGEYVGLGTEYVVVPYHAGGFGYRDLVLMMSPVTAFRVASISVEGATLPLSGVGTHRPVVVDDGQTYSTGRGEALTGAMLNDVEALAQMSKLRIISTDAYDWRIRVIFGAVA